MYVRQTVNGLHKNNTVVVFFYKKIIDVTLSLIMKIRICLTFKIYRIPGSEMVDGN